MIRQHWGGATLSYGAFTRGSKTVQNGINRRSISQRRNYDDDIRLGHLIRKLSSHRIYKSSAIGDLVLGNKDDSPASTAKGMCVRVVSSCKDDDDERPEMSFSSSIMTKPFVVMIPVLTTRLCGKNL